MTKRKREANTAIFSFGVDRNDPKYKALIQFLDGIDSGARSYVIRQILNSYVNGQTASPLFNLVVGPSQPQPAEQKTEKPKQTQVQEVINNEETETKEERTQPEPSQTRKEEQPKKRRIKRDSRLESLKNTFG